jgi:hypothetical protein
MSSQTPHDYIQTINAIVGDDVTDGEIKIKLNWADRVEAKAALNRIRLMQTELRTLRQQLVSDASSIRSDVDSKRTAVGKSLGARFAAGFLGRHDTGNEHPSTRDDLSRQEIAAVEPYEDVKRLIDAIMSALDQTKGKIDGAYTNERK